MDDNARQRVVMYTSAKAMVRELFRYMHAHIAAIDADVRVVAVQNTRRKPRLRLVRQVKKMARLGIVSTFEIANSNWLQRKISRIHQEEISRGIAALPRPDFQPNTESVVYVSDLNGPSAVAVLKEIAPAIVVQAGAGILKPQIFSLPRLGTINMHHGIAPLILGMNSIYWALWENHQDWIGATIHLIDAGIDTGRPLAYYHVDPVLPGEGFPSLYVRATQGGVQQMVNVISHLLKGETVGVTDHPREGVYRSTFSGWKMFFLEKRLARAKK